MQKIKTGNGTILPLPIIFCICTSQMGVFCAFLLNFGHKFLTDYFIFAKYFLIYIKIFDKIINR